VIEDIEGAAPELSRRGHLVVLSAAVSAVSCALLLALHVPRSTVGVPTQAASPSPSASASFSMTIVSSSITRQRVDLTRTSLCPDVARLTPPYYLAVDGLSGAVFAGTSDGRTSRSVPVAVLPDRRTSWLFVSCVTSDIVAPWIDP